MFKSFFFASTILMTLPTAAQAAVVFSSTGTSAPVGVPGLVTTSIFNAPGGAGLLSFVLDGFNTLDGANDGIFTDVFTVSVNNVAIFTGSFVLGGNGINQLTVAPVGTITSATSNGYNQGGSAQISMPVDFVNGANVVNFAYDTGSAQGMADESWGLRDIVIQTMPGVPEPASWAMMIGGLALAGAAMRRQRQRVAVRFA